MIAATLVNLQKQKGKHKPSYWHEFLPRYKPPAQAQSHVSLLTKVIALNQQFDGSDKRKVKIEHE